MKEVNNLEPKVEKMVNGLTKFLNKQGVSMAEHNTVIKDFLLSEGISKRGVRLSSYSMRVQLTQNRFRDFAIFVQRRQAKKFKENNKQ